jgi:hypothetical protein
MPRPLRPNKPLFPNHEGDYTRQGTFRLRHRTQHTTFRH